MSIGAFVVLPGSLIALATVLQAWPAVGRWVESQPVTWMVLGWTVLAAVLGPRLIGLDVARLLALVGMVLVHGWTDLVLAASPL